MNVKKRKKKHRSIKEGMRFDRGLTSYEDIQKGLMLLYAARAEEPVQREGSHSIPSLIDAERSFLEALTGSYEVPEQPELLKLIRKLSESDLIEMIYGGDFDALVKSKNDDLKRYEEHLKDRSNSTTGRYNRELRQIRDALNHSSNSQSELETLSAEESRIKLELEDYREKYWLVGSFFKKDVYKAKRRLKDVKKRQETLLKEISSPGMIDKQKARSKELEELILQEGELATTELSRYRTELISELPAYRQIPHPRWYELIREFKEERKRGEEKSLEQGYVLSWKGFQGYPSGVIDGFVFRVTDKGHRILREHVQRSGQTSKNLYIEK